MSTQIRTIAQIPDEIRVLQEKCLAVANENNLDRLEQSTRAIAEIGIRDDNQLRQANDVVRVVKIGAKALKDETDPPIGFFHGLHKMAIAAVKPYTDRFAKMETTLKSLMLNYQLEQERLHRKQQEELDRAAAEQRRRLEEEARKAMRNGDVETAREATQQAEAVVTPVLVTATPILSNTSTARTWEAEVTDPVALVKAIAEGVVPMSAIKEFDISFLKREASKRGGLDWPGVRAWQGARLSVRV